MVGSICTDRSPHDRMLAGSAPVSQVERSPGRPVEDQVDTRTYCRHRRLPQTRGGHRTVTATRPTGEAPVL